MCLRSIAYKPRTEGFGEGDGALSIKDINFRPFNYSKQNDYLKILSRCVLEIDGRWGRACCTPITFD